MATLELRFLGGVTIIQDGLPLDNLKSQKARAVLCYLAVTGRPFTRSVLAGLFWPDVSEERARTNLRKALAQLRKNLKPYLQIDRQEVIFDKHTAYWLDTEIFESLTSPSSGEEALKEAITLYAGDFLDGFYIRNAPEFEEWVLAQRTRLRELILHALHRLVTEYSQIGEYKTAIEYARQLLQFEPWREETHFQLMQLFALNGQRDLALIQFETCRRLLQDEFNIDPTPETTALYEAIRAGEISKVSKEKVDILERVQDVTSEALISARALHNLPALTTKFVGREKELTSLNALIEDKEMRLVTIVGASGMGKTRLALATAESQRGNFEHGVWFIPLATLETVAEIKTAIAETLNFKFYKVDQLEQQLLNYLRDKSLLLILDNFEHLLDGCHLVAEILKTAKGVQIIATSRERLLLQEEQLFPIEGLPFSNWVDLEDAASYAVVQLFLQSARRMMPSFQLRKEHLIPLTRICRLVAGMPLGIVLAAAWVELLDLADIANEISQSLDFLETDMQDMPERQRSIRAVFDSTWKQLTEQEQVVFQKLSIFQNSFTRQAAQTVAGASLGDLLSLRKKSLLYRTSSSRYQIHELLRQYVTEKLTRQAEDESVSEAHCQYYAAFMLQRLEPIKRMDADVIAEVATEINNIKKMWHYALQHQNFPVLAMTLRPFLIFFEFTGRFIEARNEFAIAIEHLDTQQSDELQKLVLGGSLLGYGLANVYLYHYETARQNLERSLALFRTAAFNEGIVYSLLTLSWLLILIGDYKSAETYALEALEVNDALQDLLAKADLQRILAEALIHQAEWERGVKYMQEAFELYTQLDIPRGVLLMKILSANLATYSGQFKMAEIAWQQSLLLSQQLDNMHLQARTFHGLGHNAIQLGNLTHARQCFSMSLSLLDREENTFLRVENLGDLVKLALKSNDFAQARIQLLHIAELVESIESPRQWLYWMAMCGKYFVQQGQRLSGLPLIVLVVNHSAADYESRQMAQKILNQLPQNEIPAASQSSLRSLLTETKTTLVRRPN